MGLQRQINDIRSSTISSGGSGTVTDVSVVTANGVSGSVSNSTTTPAITLTLGAINPSSLSTTTGDIATLNTTQGNITTLNTTSGGIVTLTTTTGNIANVIATTVGANNVNAGEVTVSKSQNGETQINVHNADAGIAAIAEYTLWNGVYEADILLTGTGFTDFPNVFVITSDAPGGFIIESTASDITIAPAQEVNGNGFNVNLTAAEGFDSGVTARDGGNVVLQAGLAVNAGVNGGVKIPVIKSGATQAAAGALANEIWKTAFHSTLPDNVLMIGV